MRLMLLAWDEGTHKKRNSEVMNMDVPPYDGPILQNVVRNCCLYAESQFV